MALTPSVSSAPRQLSDSNGVGTVLGSASNPNTANGLDLIGFFGGGTNGAVNQPSGGFFAAINQNASMGNAANYVVNLAPSAVSANSTSEQITAVGALAATDILLVNKPTSQAGLAVASGRVSSAGNMAITYVNDTAGGITPTTEVYNIWALPAQFVITQALTPAAVPANTTAEQQFTVPGLYAGQFVQVNKPSAQTGLAVMTARVISNNLLGITFINVTASPITPTAAETYTILGTSAISMRSNVFEVQSSIAPVAVAANTTAEQTVAVPGVLATDLVLGISKPTAQAGLGIVGMRVPSAGNIAITYVNDTAGSLTPTSEANNFLIYRRNPLPVLAVVTQTLTPTSVAANTAAEQIFTLTGANAGFAVATSAAWVNKPSFQAGLSIGGVRVSSANNIGITFVNNTAAAIVPTAEAYTIALTGFAQGANNALTAGSLYPVDPVFQAIANQMIGLRNAFGPAGLNLVGAS